MAFGHFKVLRDKARDQAVPESLQAVLPQELASLRQLGERVQLVEDRKEAIKWTQVGV